MAVNPRAGVKLFVSRLHWTTGIDMFKNYFAQYGKVNSGNITYDMETGFSKGYGFITMDSWSAANRILEKDLHSIGRSMADVKLDKRQDGSSMGGAFQGMPTVEDSSSSSRGDSGDVTA